VQQLEAAFPQILQEFQEMREKGLLFQVNQLSCYSVIISLFCGTYVQTMHVIVLWFCFVLGQPYRAPLSGREGKSVDERGELATDKGGDWNVCYLLLHGMDSCFEQNRDACPCTMRAIAGVPRQHNHAFFSALAPLTHVQGHCGPTNKKLRCHLPLVVPSLRGVAGEAAQALCTVTVGGITRELVPGRAIIFDDSFWHEAENRARPSGQAAVAGVVAGGGRLREDGRGGLEADDGLQDELDGSQHGVKKGVAGVAMRDDGRGDLEAVPTADDEDELDMSEHRKTVCGGESTGPRVVLIFDVWHPDLSDEEVGRNIVIMIVTFASCRSYDCSCRSYDCCHNNYNAGLFCMIADKVFKLFGQCQNEVCQEIHICEGGGGCC
jgi:hypothetical protein